MVLFLYSDDKYEYQAIGCLKSLEDKVTDDIKLVYYTIGFNSDFECKNLQKIKIEPKNHPTFHFYKFELSLDVIKRFPNERYFIFSDTDIVYSRRFEFEKLKHEYNYPLASFGPHEYPYRYEFINDEKIIYDETALQKYMNVQNRTMRYVFSCFYTFNASCKNFFEECALICNIKPLKNSLPKYFPLYDETPFNVCLWKYGATKNLGHMFVNTHLLETIIKVETSESIKMLDTHNVIDNIGESWEYIDDSSKIIFYHGIKDKDTLDKIVEYLLSQKTKVKHIKNNRKIGIVTLYDINYKEYADLYSIPNKKEYAEKYGYDLIYFTDALDMTRPPPWSKIKAVEYALKDYDWIWWVDIDIHIMNFDIKLESIIDENFDIILTKNDDSYISTASCFFKNTEFTRQFLIDCYELKLECLQDVQPQNFDYEQQSVRAMLLKNSSVYRSKIKLIDERVCNSYCVTKNENVLQYYPDWNTKSNIYQEGDFVIHFCGRTFDERLRDMKEYIRK